MPSTTKYSPNPNNLGEELHVFTPITSPHTWRWICVCEYDLHYPRHYHDYTENTVESMPRDVCFCREAADHPCHGQIPEEPS